MRNRKWLLTSLCLVVVLGMNIVAQTTAPPPEPTVDEARRELEKTPCRKGAGWNGIVIVREYRHDNEHKYIGKGENFLDYDRSSEYSSQTTFDYDGKIYVSSSTNPGDKTESGAYSILFKGDVKATAQRLFKEAEIADTLSKCFGGSPGAVLHTDRHLTIDENGTFYRPIDGSMWVEGNGKYGISFEIPELPGTYKKDGLLQTKGSCNPEGDEPVVDKGETDITFDRVAIEVEGKIDPVKKDVISGSKTIRDDGGTVTHIVWLLRYCP